MMVDKSSERVKKRRELKSAATDVYRRAILDAAEKVFGEKSFAHAKIADVAREAGMASGTLYNYFDSKEQVFESLCEARSEELLGRFDAVSKAESSPVERLVELVRACLQHVEEHRAMVAIFLELGMTEAAPSAQRHDRFVRHFERTMREAIVADIFRRDYQVGDLVAFLTGAMKGYIRAWIVAGGRKGLAAKAPSIVEIFLRGAVAR